MPLLQIVSHWEVWEPSARRSNNGLLHFAIMVQGHHSSRRVNI